MHGAKPAESSAVSGNPSSLTFRQKNTLKSLASNARERVRVNKILEEHMEEIIYPCKKTFTFEWLPGYHVKTGSSRIQGAQALRQCIKKHGLKLLTVPKKHLYPISKKHRDNISRDSYFKNDPFIVVAEQINQIPDGVMNLEHAKEIYFLLSHAKYGSNYFTDASNANLVFCSDGKIAFIDTEKGSFMATKPFYGVVELLKYGNRENKDPQALQFFQEKCIELQYQSADQCLMQ